MESCAVHLVSHFKCNFHTSFGQIRLVYHRTNPWDIPTRWPSCHLKIATASLRRRFLCCLWWRGVSEQPRPSRRRGRRRQGMVISCFSTYFCQVSDRCVSTKSDFLFRGTPVGLLEIGGSPETAMAQWQNNLSFQSFLHRSCLRVECHVVSVSFVSLRNCGACPLVAPANHDSGHRAIRCCIFEDGDDVDRKEVKQKAAFSF